MKQLRVGDPILFWLSILITGIGLFFAFDAGYARSIQNGYGPVPREFTAQILPILIGIPVAIWIGSRGTETLKKRAKLIWWIAFLSLFLPMMPVIGLELNGAARWVKIWKLPMIQPAEFVKTAAILYLAAMLANRKAWPKVIKPARDVVDYLDRIAWPKLKRCWPGLFVLLAVFMIEQEPDLGTAAVLGATALLMCIVGGVSWRSLAVAGVLAGMGATVMVIQQPYRLERFKHHFARWTEERQDDTGYQTVQSEIAQASGGALGVGVGSGRAKHVMPAATTDFIMATIGEELGIWGSCGIILILGGIVGRLVVLANQTKDRFRMLIFYGVGGWIGIQTVVNVVMANGVLPAIGIPMPFVSTGGSSLLALWMAIGLAQSAARPVSVTEEAYVDGRNRRRNRWPRLSRA
ncbi:MAG TPA: FtsW/RodA/SpoVE family cell cycle protein [Fimbriimonadaceae bacterium]|nr:FtsW/RodA/SpoVE family cell cycle protein [Fimbriimonadaceae bacterium]